MRAGADKVSINTSAVTDPSLIDRAAARFGTQCIVVAIDVRANPVMQEGKTPVVLADGREVWYEVVTMGGSHPTRIDAGRSANEVEGGGAGEIRSISRESSGHT